MSRLRIPSAILAAGLLLAACGGSAAPSAAPASSAAAPSGPAASAAAKPASAAPSASAKPAASAAAPASAKPAASGPQTGVAAASAAAQTQTQVNGGDPNGYPVRIGYGALGSTNFPFYAGLDYDFFKNQHLNIKMTMTAPNVAITALANGDLDFVNQPTTGIEGAANGLPMKVVISFWKSATWTVVGKPEIKTLADLKGKQVGNGLPGTGPYAYLQAALKQANVSPSDVKIVSVPSTSQVLTQLLAGVTDAAVLSTPFDFTAEEKGFHEVKFIGDALEIPSVGLAGSTAFITQHRPQAVALMKALMDSSAWLKTHPAEAAALDVKYGKETEDIARKTAEKMLPLLSETGEASPTGIQQALDSLAEVTKKPVTVTPDQVVDYGPLREALAQK